MDWSLFNTQLRIAVDTGKVKYGTKEAIKECLIGDPKILIVSKTMKSIIKKELEYYCDLLNIKCIHYPESGFELGSVCGKPFNVSVITINDFGESSLNSVVEEKDTIVNEVTGKVKKKKEKKEKKQKIMEEKENIKKIKALKKKEEEDIPLKDDAMFKDIIKIKKK